MTTPLLCESPERRHPQEKCASKCVGTPRGLPARGPRIRGTRLSAFICFLTHNDLRPEIRDLKLILHVWLSSKGT